MDLGSEEIHKEAFSTSPELPACLSGVSLAEEGHQPSTNPLPALGQPCPAPTTVSEHCGAFVLDQFSSRAGATLFRIPGTKLPVLFAGLFLPEQERKSEWLSCHTACGEVFAVSWMESLLEGALLNHLPPQPAAVNQTPRQTALPRSRGLCSPDLALHCAMKMELSQQPQLLLGSKPMPLNIIVS